MKRFTARFITVMIILFSPGFSDVVRQNNVSLREGTGSYYPVIAVLQSGEDVTVLEPGDDWCRVRTGSGSEGFIPSRVFSEEYSGIDYGVLSGQIADRDISKTLVSAAVKGFFEFSVQNPALNRAVLHKPYRQYFTPSQYSSFKNQSFKDSPWSHEKYLRKIRLPKEKPLVVDQKTIVNSGYIAARLAAPGLIKDMRKTAYVNMVAQLVSESTGLYDMPVTVLIVDSKEVFANSTPGGIIIISEGMLGKIESEHELACLLGHEIAHVTMGHGATEIGRRKPKMRAESAFDDMEDEFGEKDDDEREMEAIADEMFERSIKGRKEEYESEADMMGALYAARAGYDPLGMLNIMARLKGSMKRSDNFENATHWFPYSFKNREAALKKYYTENLERRAPKFVQHRERWQNFMY